MLSQVAGGIKKIKIKMFIQQTISGKKKKKKIYEWCYHGLPGEETQKRQIVKTHTESLMHPHEEQEHTTS